MLNKIKRLFGKKKVTVERGYDANKNILDGKKFISFNTSVTNSGSLMSRSCENCKFCEGDIIKHCKNKEVKEHFGYESKEIMSLKFGTKHRGYFCKFFKLSKKFKR